MRGSASCGSRSTRDQPLSPVEERLFADLAAQAGLVLRGARLRAELARRAEDLATLADDLQASRRRVVDAHDSERRRLERDIHDGAQQHLVALVVNLRLAQTLIARSPDRARAVLAEQGDAVDNAITSLVDLSRGIYPKVLTEDGVAAAVRDVVSTSTIPVAVLDRGIGRHDDEIETALYFCCVEAVQNAVKHAAASRIEVELARTVGERLELLVRDDGHGFDVAAVLAAGGLGNLRDRVDSVSGDLAVRTNETGGTDVVISVRPRRPDVQARRVAWIAAGISLLLAVVDTALVVASYPPLSVRSTGIHGWPLVNLAGLGSAVLGAVILGATPASPDRLDPAPSSGSRRASRSPRSPTGSGCSSTTATAPRRRGISPAGSPPSSEVPMALACLTGVFLLVPDGHVPVGPVALGRPRRPGRRTACTCSGSLLVGPNGVNRNGDPIDAGPVTLILLSGGVVLITLMLLASVVAMLRRLRGSTGAARQQLRVVTIGAAGVGLALLVLIIGQSLNEGRQTWWTSVPLYVSYVLLVVCIAVAVLRYRLYEVEVIVSRAVALAIATAFVAIGYVGLVVVLGRTVEDRTGGGFWWSLLATVVVALAFQPLRRRVLAVADRLAYGNRAAPYDALADFSGRIGRSPATDELLPTIAAAAGEAVHAQRAVVRLDGRGRRRSDSDVAGRRRPGRASTRLTVAWWCRSRTPHGLLGSVVLTLPPGRDIRPLERRLLSDIAEQAALALRNVRLELELAARVRQLDRHTRELTASRNRIIGAVDTERRRLESSIAVRVLPTMVRLRSEVARSATGGAQADRIEECVDLATEALESLRELTRGIYPTILTRSGLGSALSSHAGRVRRGRRGPDRPGRREREVPRARRGRGLLLLRGGARARGRRDRPDPRRHDG